MKTIVLPTSWCSRMTSFCMSRRISGSSAENGSSNISSVGVVGQRAGQADPLLHAAGELVGVGVLVAAQADQVEHLLGPVAALGLVLAAHLEPEGDVVEHVAVRQQPEVLEHHRHVVAAQLAQRFVVGAGDVLAVDRHRARGRLDQPGEQRTSVDLPGAGQAHHHEHLARRDVEGDVLDRR